MGNYLMLRNVGSAREIVRIKEIFKFMGSQIIL